MQSLQDLPDKELENEKYCTVHTDEAAGGAKELSSFL